MARVLVVGAGVTGLSCAVRLLERGHEVGVVARDLPLETTSVVAAALWYPYLAHPPDRVAAWAHTTYAELARLAADPETGIALRPGTEVLRRPAALPDWLAAVRGAGTTTEVPTGYAAGWTFVAPVIEMPTYLRWLTGRIDALGGTVTRMALAALPDQAEVVVDAAGLGARLLAQDPSVVPVRGQVVHVEQVGLDHWWLDDAGPTYVIPRSRDIVVGGTEEHGAWDRRPDPAVAEELLRRATALVPELRGARVLGHRVGLRPARPAVRLEEAGPVRTRSSGGRVVHCYGHGGSGITLSWGCAAEVAALVGDP
jgi:D-amino-acid oxidase